MRVIIAGSRDIHDYDRVAAHIKSTGFKITEVVSGKCSGVDALGERWAIENKIPVKEFPALWHAHGKAAGPIRNKQMAEYADALIVVTTGESRGSMNMIDNMNRLGKPVRWDMRRSAVAVAP